jgi:flavin reductase (DIM6/NTAB) family NADH-FMN oxidoreductase RutF
LELPLSQIISMVPDQMDPRQAYRLLTSVVVPRPIAWVSTIGANGTLNLAPFSFFNAVGGEPPTVMFSVGLRRGETKDTLRNAQETGEFVLNLVDETLAAQMNTTSGEWAYEVNEFDIAGLTTLPSLDVRPPRVAGAKVAMEARVTQIVPVNGTGNTLVLGRILRYHVQEDLLRSDGTVDALMLKPVARLSRDEYATIGRVFSMTRPHV